MSFYRHLQLKSALRHNNPKDFRHWWSPCGLQDLYLTIIITVPSPIARCATFWLLFIIIVDIWSTGLNQGYSASISVAVRININKNVDCNILFCFNFLKRWNSFKPIFENFTGRQNSAALVDGQHIAVGGVNAFMEYLSSFKRCSLLQIYHRNSIFWLCAYWKVLEFGVSKYASNVGHESTIWGIRFLKHVKNLQFRFYDFSYIAFPILALFVAIFKCCNNNKNRKVS